MNRVEAVQIIEEIVAFIDTGGVIAVVIVEHSVEAVGAPSWRLPVKRQPRARTDVMNVVADDRHARLRAVSVPGPTHIKTAKIIDH